MKIIPTISFRPLGLMFLVCLFTACSGGSPDNARRADEAVAPPASGEVIAGRTYDVTLQSNIDNADIAFTVHEPEVLVGGLAYPLILQSHGYAGSRQAERPAPDSFIGQFLVNDFGVLSLDERGNGESGGTVRILDPAFEGQDWLQVLDWVEENLVWLEYEPADADEPDTGFGKGNPVIGSIWSSYGGGFQHLIYAIDNKHRLDAIAPDITWNDLRYSLFSGGVFKSLWGTLLAGLGSAPPNTQDQEINEGLAQGNGMNTLDADKQALLYGNSLESHCNFGDNEFTTDGGLRQMDAFYTQSHLDTLFNFNDAFHNFDCLRELGGDVRLMTKSVGHGLDNGDGGDNCGVITRQQATLAWHMEKLQGVTGAADHIPDICYNLGSVGDDGIIVDDVTIGGSEPNAFSQSNVPVGNTAPPGAIVVEPPLFTAPAGGEVLAGIPTINFSLTDALPATLPGVDDPIVFIGIGVRRGGVNPTKSLMNQIRPFRGFDDYEEELIGVFERLEEGDEVVLMLFPNDAASFDAVQAGNPPGTSDVGQYPTNASTVQHTINLEGTVQLPLIGTDHEVPGGPDL